MTYMSWFNESKCFQALSSRQFKKSSTTYDSNKSSQFDYETTESQKQHTSGVAGFVR